MTSRPLASLALSLALFACGGAKRSIEGPTHEHEHCHDLPDGSRQCHTHPHNDLHRHSGPTTPAGSSSVAAPAGTVHEHEHCHERAGGNECHTHPHGDDHHEAPPAASAPKLEWASVGLGWGRRAARPPGSGGSARALVRLGIAEVSGRGGHR